MVDTFLENKILKWFGHCLRREPNHICAKLLRVEVSGRRNRGRPKKRWRDNIQGDLKKYQLTEDITRDHRVMISSTQVTPVQRHGSSCRSFSGLALSTMSINIEGYSQAKAEIVSTFAHGYDIVCMQETHIGPEHCRPSIYGMKLIAEIRHRKYGSAVYAKPTLNIEEVHTEVTDSQIELITVSLAKITITSVYKPPASEFEWPSLPERCRRPLHLVIGDFNSQSTAWGYEQNDCNGDLVEAWAEASNFSLIHDAKLPNSFDSARWKRGYNPDVAFVSTRIASM